MGKYESGEQKRRKKKEFSKIVIGLSMVIYISVVVFICYMMYSIGDLTPSSYLLSAVSVVSSAAVGFYFNKAKTENKIKLMRACGVEITESSFNENNY